MRMEIGCTFSENLPVKLTSPGLVDGPLGQCQLKVDEDVSQLHRVIDGVYTEGVKVGKCAARITARCSVGAKRGAATWRNGGKSVSGSPSHCLEDVGLAALEAEVLYLYTEQVQH